MLPYGELEYSGFRSSIGDLVNRFAFRNGKSEEAAIPESVGNSDD
jgi:hypothetical protein